MEHLERLFQQFKIKPKIRKILLVLSFPILSILIVISWLFIRELVFPRWFASQDPEQVPVLALIEATLTARMNTTATLNATPISQSSLTTTPFPQNPTQQPVNETRDSNEPSFIDEEWIILSIEEAGYSHLFVYQPYAVPRFTRLTNGAWCDITPAVSPDGRFVAFSSNRNGFWDLYHLDLRSGGVIQLTYTPEYEAYPTWSPDGLWLAYERYQPSDNERKGNLDIFVRDANDPSSEPIRLTSHPGADHSPAWSPLGRKLAIISTRSGENEVWLVDLDQTEQRFENISRNQDQTEAHPSWSPDGEKLAWAATDQEGFQNLNIWNRSQPDMRPTSLDMGDWSAWKPESDTILTSLRTPNHTYLTAYNLKENNLVFPLIPLSGAMHGMSWGKGALWEHLPDDFLETANVTPTAAWSPVLQPGGDMPGERRKVVVLENLESPGLSLHDAVDESYYALRERLSIEAGWDYLSVLEDTFLPLTSPLEPGMQEDWLYTGRGFRTNLTPFDAGWLVAVRENYGPQVFWKLYLKARFQDGSQGAPLKQIPWDFSVRQSGDPLSYMRGGAFFEELPEGYWVDMTEYARAFGWYRQPSLPTWRSCRR